MVEKREAAEELRDLIDICKTLLGPNGCPWDRDQSPEDIKSQIVEETYELLEAIDQGNEKHLAEEMGDLLYQIVFLAEKYEKENKLSLTDAITSISEKLVRRHPHVFKEAEADTPEEGIARWEEIKQKERSEQEQTNETPAIFSGVPDSLPALLRAYRLTQKAAAIGFDWNETGAALEKMEEELNELKQAEREGTDENRNEELGDLLFACANYARKQGVDPEETLQQGNDKFIKRFSQLMSQIEEEDHPLRDIPTDRIVSLWNDTSTTSSS